MPQLHEFLCCCFSLCSTTCSALMIMINILNPTPTRTAMNRSRMSDYRIASRRWDGMLSGLYGDLPEAKNTAAQSGSEGGGWAAKPKFAPPSRKPGGFAAPRSVLGAAKRPQRESESEFWPDFSSLKGSLIACSGKKFEESIDATFGGLWV